MIRFGVLFGREIGATFHSLAYYVLLAKVTLLLALFFNSALAARSFELNWALHDLYATLIGLTLFVAPLLTMRSFAEEKRSGSFELLMTAPVGDATVVAAKYMAAVCIFATFVAPVWVLHVLLASFFDANPDWGQLASLSIGVFGQALVFLAAGVLASALTSAQLFAALLAWVICTFFVAAGGLWRLFEPGSFWQQVFRYASLDAHMRTAAAGIIDLRHIVFQLSLVALLLFWTVRVVEARKWR